MRAYITFQSDLKFLSPHVKKHTMLYYYVELDFTLYISLLFHIDFIQKLNQNRCTFDGKEGIGKLCNGTKVVSSINGAGRTEYLHTKKKKESRHRPYIIYKN